MPKLCLQSLMQVHFCLTLLILSFFYFYYVFLIFLFYEQIAWSGLFYFTFYLNGRAFLLHFKLNLLNLLIFLLKIYFFESLFDWGDATYLQVSLHICTFEISVVFIDYFQVEFKLFVEVGLKLRKEAFGREVFENVFLFGFFFFLLCLELF